MLTGLFLAPTTKFQAERHLGSHFTYIHWIERKTEACRDGMTASRYHISWQQTMGWKPALRADDALNFSLRSYPTRTKNHCLPQPKHDQVSRSLVLKYHLSPNHEKCHSCLRPLSKPLRGGEGAVKPLSLNQDILPRSTSPQQVGRHSASTLILRKTIVNMTRPQAWSSKSRPGFRSKSGLS